MTERVGLVRCCSACRRGMPGMGGNCGQPACGCHNPVQERCRALLGSDRCEDVVGHDGDHRAMWGGGVQCRWPDDYELNRYLPDSIEPAPIVHQFDTERRSTPSSAAHTYDNSKPSDRQERPHSA